MGLPVNWTIITVFASSCTSQRNSFHQGKRKNKLFKPKKEKKQANESRSSYLCENTNVRIYTKFPPEMLETVWIGSYELNFDLYFSLIEIIWRCLVFFLQIVKKNLDWGTIYISLKNSVGIISIARFFPNEKKNWGIFESPLRKTNLKKNLSSAICMKKLIP